MEALSIQNRPISYQLKANVKTQGFVQALLPARKNARVPRYLKVRASDADKPSPSSETIDSTSSSSSPVNSVDVVQPRSMDELNTSPRRLVLSGLTATGLALGGNFLGVTSALLGSNPELAHDLRLDIVVPVNGFKRCVNKEEGYEFLYPAEWLEDQRMVLRNAERRQLDLDPLSSRELQERQRRRRVAEPTAAYGPPAGSGEENVSVIAAPIFPGFTMESMGTPKYAAEDLLNTTIAPPGSGKVATLLDAKAEVHDGELYYIMEYTVETPKWARHNFAVFVSKNATLLTFNAQASKAQWDTYKDRFQIMADSFRVLL